MPEPRAHTWPSTWPATDKQGDRARGPQQPRLGHRQFVKDCGRNHSEHRGRPVWLTGHGSWLLGAGAPRGDQWERPVECLGVHHMAWPADMQCRGERYCAAPSASCEP